MLKVTIPMPGLLPMNLPEMVLEAFEAAAGPIAVAGVQAVLGTSEMGLSLTDKYRERKEAGKIKGMKRIAGKNADQPGILTASLFEGVNHVAEPGVGFSVGVEDDAGVSEDGDDYAARLEARTEFLETGVSHVEEPMRVILEATLNRVIAEAGG